MTSPMPNGLPHLGYGVGFRGEHKEHVFERQPDVDWFEIISENYMATSGLPMYALDQLIERYPVILHGVAMSIGTTSPIDFDYLRQLRQLADRVHSPWVTDHICWTGMSYHNSHDLLPVPYNEETLAHLVERIRIVQDFMERPLGFENPSTYVEFVDSTMSEAEFLGALVRESGCMLLLDVNNIYVSCFNHGWDADDYLAHVPFDKVVQFHLAGHTNHGTHIIDTHADYVIDEVWTLYRKAHELSGGRPTLLEWDSDIPDFDVVHGEVLKAKQHVESLTADTIPERKNASESESADVLSA